MKHKILFRQLFFDEEINPKLIFEISCGVIIQSKLCGNYKKINTREIGQIEFLGENLIATKTSRLAFLHCQNKWRIGSWIERYLINEQFEFHECYGDLQEIKKDLKSMKNLSLLSLIGGIDLSSSSM